MIVKVLVLGASGLLGNACMRILGQRSKIHVVGTYRTKFEMNASSKSKIQYYQIPEILDTTLLEKLFKIVAPDVVINCVSLSKKDISQAKPLNFIPIYSLLPHLIHDLCRLNKARLIQISSDGVFSGVTGNYSEIDKPDADDIYGKSKLLGEVISNDSITLRTSMVGHSMNTNNGLISWFLDQKVSCKGFKEVIFSGFPVNILAEIISDYIIPKPNLCGIYHIASSPISKLDLLLLVAKRYCSSVEIIPDSSIKINRSLDGRKFAKDVNYQAPQWIELVRMMHEDYKSYN